MASGKLLALPNKMKKYLSKIIFALICFLLFFLTIRGNFGNPSANQIDFTLSSSGKAFETSQERSRYAIILSLVNHGRFDLGEYASMGTPDIGVSGGKYYSFFPPATSILAIPLYLLGVKLNMAQLLTFLVSTIFSVLTMISIYAFTKKQGLANNLSLFAAFAFGFATNAWGYSVTLYAHLLSAFSVIFGLHLITKKSPPTFLNYILVWFVYAFAIFVDFPNIFTYFPIALVASFKMFDVQEVKNYLKVTFKPLLLFGPILLFSFLSVYGYYNFIHFGSPFKMSNTIKRVKDLKDTDLSVPEKGSDAVGALETRSLTNGLHSFVFSTDRGLLIYTPIALLSLFGLFALKNKGKDIKNLLVAIPLVSLFTYSMFGDPYGGWAFGSRYLISVLPELIVLAVMGLDYLLQILKAWQGLLLKIFYALVFAYSTAVSLLAPLTTNVISPLVEGRNLGLISDYTLNIKMLQSNELNSFVFNNFIGGQVTGVQYYFFILSLVYIVGFYLIFISKPNKNNKSYD